MNEHDLVFFLIGLNVGLLIGTAVRVWHIWLRLKKEMY